MSYLPSATDKARTQRTEGRRNPVQPPRRAPNDFLDYNHGPDSYGDYQPQSSSGWNAFGNDRKNSQRQ